MESIAKAYATEKGLQFGRRVGAGAFKETYVASGQSDRFALKIIGTKASDARTKREIAAMVRCSHPNIARLISVEKIEFEGTVYTCLLEEYLAGGTLAERLQQGPLSPEAIDKLGAAMIEVLEHLFGLGLVHRDLKPDNIMFRSTDSSAPVVVDFGLVRDLSRSSLTNTWAPMGPGTPLFAPPEQLNNRKEMIDWRSDQFALAVTLITAAGLNHPYWATGDKSYECIERVANYEEPKLELTSALAPSQFAALAKMVLPFPIERFRTPQQLRQSWTTE